MSEWPFQGLTPHSYRVIYCDPPWSFSAGGKRNPRTHYQTMPIREIAELPVKDLAHPEGCRLLMWATAPILLLPFGPREVMKAWGFRYSTSRIWRKLWPREDGLFEYPDSQARGTGFEATGDWEILIIGKRGKPESIKGRVPRGCVSARRREHSRKPEIFRSEIRSLFSGPRCELFARSPAEGFDVWGNENTKYEFQEAAE